MIPYVVNFFATPVPDYGQLIKAQSMTGTSSNYKLKRKEKRR